MRTSQDGQCHIKVIANIKKLIKAIKCSRRSKNITVTNPCSIQVEQPSGDHGLLMDPSSRESAATGNQPVSAALLAFAC